MLQFALQTFFPYENRHLAFKQKGSRH